MRTMTRPQHRKPTLRTKVALALTAVVGLGFLSACSEDTSGPKGQEAENKSRQSNYEQLVKKQPAKSMGFSPTRATKNFWIETWDEPGKLSYVYLQGSTGDLLGYYVLEGLPVSYCTSLIPPYQKIRGDLGQYGGDLIVPGPSVDGSFSSGANCDTYYGKDASSGSYIEYTAGLGINVLLYDQPLARQDVQPLGQTTIEEAKAKKP